MADTAVRSSAIGSAATGTAASVSAPAGVAAGDVVLVSVLWNGSVTIVDNNGTTPFTVDLPATNMGGAGGITVAQFSRRILAGDPSTYNFTGGATDRWTVIAVAIQNPHATLIYDVPPQVGLMSGSASGASSTSGVWCALTTNAPISIHCGLSCADNPGTSIVPPAGYTTEQNGGSGQSMAFSDRRITGVQTIAPMAFTWTTGAGWLSLTFSVMDNSFVSPTRNPARLTARVPKQQRLDDVP